MKKIARSFLQYATIKTISALVGTLILIASVVLPKFVERFQPDPVAHKMLGFRLFYSPETAAETIASYGQQGKKQYIQFLLTGDILYPAVIAVTVIFLLEYLRKKGQQKETFFVLLPFATMIFDYLENAAIILFVTRHPEASSILGWVATTFTLSKWISAAVSALLCIYLIIVWYKDYKKGKLLPSQV